MAYRRAPVTEALIDIRVELPSAVGIDDLQAIKEQISHDYPREEPRNLTQVTSSFGLEVKATAQQKKLGYAFFSADGRQVFQARVDGFTFSRLEPYETWLSLSGEARRLWNIYRDSLKPTGISRVAVRFINQLNLPGNTIEPEDYLNTFVKISDRLPEPLRQIGPFLMSLRIPQQDLSGLMILNEALGQQKVPNTVAVILDLDLFVEHPQINDEAGLWDLFERLRERKNVYFEACITDKTRELIS